MGEANKILSVSYGTFSCRLEGFEDSVETLKTVVSYFHDLAGHDRFMDMDPQAPDLDELAELTVEEDGATVEAATSAGGISLRIPRPDTEEPARPSLRLRREEPVQETPELLDDDVSDLDDLDDLSDLDDVAAEDLDHQQDVEDDVFAEDDTVEADDVVAQDSSEDDSAEEDAADHVAEDAAPVAEDHVADDDIAKADDMVEAATDEVIAEHDNEDAASDDDGAAYEDEDEDVADAPFYDPAAAQPASENDESVAAKLERIRSLVGRVPPANRTAAPDAGAPAAPASSIADRLSALTGKAPEPDPQTEDLVDDFDFKADNAAPLVLSDDVSGDGGEDTPTDQMITADDDFGDDEIPDLGAQTDAEDAQTDLPAETTAEDDEIARRRANYSKRDNLPENDDDAMSRIMSQADERLNEPEGRRHRDAFAQLKAAVAATEAARQLGDQSDDADPRDAFREDLDEAVRTDDDETPISRPVSTPLKLVAAQRIEEESAAPADRLRQIAAVKDSGDVEKGGFAEFASEKGATELADLLEAAAAYIAFVEGDDDFSRPQVMKKVQMASADQFTREDGLRSFGRLLRQSRIIKLNNGRFQVSEDTRFRPDDKAAQG